MRKLKSIKQLLEEYPDAHKDWDDSEVKAHDIIRKFNYKFKKKIRTIRIIVFKQKELG